MQPMSQAMKEYAEMKPFFERAQELLTQAPGERIQMLTRFGYASAKPPVPRWPLVQKIRSA